MTRFFGAVGYGEQVLKSPGIWGDLIVEFNYYGDVKRDSRRFSEGQSVNDDLTVNNTISIVADKYAIDHLHAIRYVVLYGARWKVSTIDASRAPRLLLQLGGVYNGPGPDPVTP